MPALPFSSDWKPRPSDGATALRIAMMSRPDVALVDIGLPVLDGYELARAIRKPVDPVRLAEIVEVLTASG